MVNHYVRTQAGLADLVFINAEIDRNGLPTPRDGKNRVRKLDPLSEE